MAVYISSKVQRLFLIGIPHFHTPHFLHPRLSSLALDGNVFGSCLEAKAVLPLPQPPISAPPPSLKLVRDGALCQCLAGCKFLNVWAVHENTHQCGEPSSRLRGCHKQFPKSMSYLAPFQWGSIPVGIHCQGCLTTQMSLAPLPKCDVCPLLGMGFLVNPTLQVMGNWHYNSGSLEPHYCGTCH